MHVTPEIGSHQTYIGFFFTPALVGISEGTKVNIFFVVQSQTLQPILMNSKFYTTIDRGNFVHCRKMSFLTPPKKREGKERKEEGRREEIWKYERKGGNKRGGKRENIRRGLSFDTNRIIISLRVITIFTEDGSSYVLTFHFLFYKKVSIFWRGRNGLCVSIDVKFRKNFRKTFKGDVHV